ncbi:transposase [Pseudogracilibacillus auburnensis]|uniref:transposase n=1 Tax=Pseudogracilibacillus auburnensis TaxID=1494959 RepID=UPI001A961A75|nr:transposase [Pseudogracilibacillus auburnensis]MBO1001269.1 transposase [Pseudogracilibacillus auburnensis]
MRLTKRRVSQFYLYRKCPNIHLKEKGSSYTNHDLLFKQLIRYFFKDFLFAFFPNIYEQLDLNSITFLSGEVFTDIVKGSSRRLDLVINMKIKNTESMIIIHVEPQSSIQADFHERMFQYYSLLYNEYRKPIIPIAIFSYLNHWEQNQFNMKVLDKTYLSFKYHTLHLKKMYWRDYLKKDNPVVAALLSKMDFKEEEKYKVKAEFVRMLWRLQLNEADQRLLYGFFETYVTLTEKEEAKFVESVKEFDHAEEILNIPISYEEKGRKQGMKEGKKEVAIELLREGMPFELIQKTTKITINELKELKKQL